MVDKLVVALVTLQLQSATLQDAVESGFNPSAGEWNEIQAKKNEVIEKMIENEELF